MTLLWQLGHRRLALINGSEALAFARERRAGFEGALKALGAGPGAGRVMSGDATETQGYLATLAALNAGDGPPTAFICGSTAIAAGALRAIADAGLRVPQDVSVIAHDDQVPRYPAGEMLPPLTATHAALTDACGPLVELLIAQLSGEAEARQCQIRQRPELIVRKSTGPAPGARG